MYRVNTTFTMYCCICREYSFVVAKFVYSEAKDLVQKEIKKTVRFRFLNAGELFALRERNFRSNQKLIYHKIKKRDYFGILKAGGFFCGSPTSFPVDSKTAFPKNKNANISGFCNPVAFFLFSHVISSALKNLFPTNIIISVLLGFFTTANLFQVSSRFFQSLKNLCYPI